MTGNLHDNQTLSIYLKPTIHAHTHTYCLRISVNGIFPLFLLLLNYLFFSRDLKKSQIVQISSLKRKTSKGVLFSGVLESTLDMRPGGPGSNPDHSSCVTDTGDLVTMVPCFLLHKFCVIIVIYKRIGMHT